MDTDLQDIEIGLLVEGIYQVCGYDFRDYAAPSLRRRVLKCLRDEKLETVSALQERVFHDGAAMKRLLVTLSVSTTSMYRDPFVFRSFRDHGVPLLQTYPFVRIWHAGCSGGHEPRSMAILLEEESLYDRCRLYATDINEDLVAEARAGIYPVAAMQQYTRNYLQAGGKRAFSEYYTAAYDRVTFRRDLDRNIVWAQHNLVTDGCFNTFQAILCRNVLIYFDRSLQARVHKLLYESLEPFGILVLGNRESLHFTPYEACYEEIDGRARLYRKVR
jgi:chemotaxis protein methyltransferase CheR